MQLALEPTQHLFLGELGLDGSLRHTTGILPLVALARERGIPTVYVPAINALEAALIREVEVAMGLKPVPCGLERTFATVSTQMVRADAGATDEQPPAAG